MNKNPFKYLQIYEDVIAKIRQGELVSGDRMMTEDQLAAFYQVSRVTIRKALDKLCAENYLERQKHAGAFIHPKLVEIANRNSFVSFTKDNELRGHQVTTKTLSLKQCHPDNYVRSRLPEVSAEQDLWYLKRLRYVNRLAVLYEESYWFKDLCKDLDEQIVLGSMCEYLEKLGIYIAKAQNEYIAIKADETIAGLLEVPLDFPILLTKAVYLTSDQQPIFVTRNYCRTDRTSIQVTLNRQTF
ncbi:Mannosyl-D-glycerate transport/metabolism system repressor MngR [bioreactor metagenome]|uniref:Mannosyl-D-glycerate transport/metabolism system repressor MngR n=1 Tax=bioreactor metagenome TaxID=1076179 RepID=A0A645D0I0_9ZZZZ